VSCAKLAGRAFAFVRMEGEADWTARLVLLTVGGQFARVRWCRWTRRGGRLPWPYWHVPDAEPGGHGGRPAATFVLFGVLSEISGEKSVNGGNSGPPLESLCMGDATDAFR
jgi:hypothetical protein